MGVGIILLHDVIAAKGDNGEHEWVQLGDKSHEQGANMCQAASELKLEITQNFKVINSFFHNHRSGKWLYLNGNDPIFHFHVYWRKAT